MSTRKMNILVVGVGVGVIVSLEVLHYTKIVAVDFVDLLEDLLVFTSPVPNLKLNIYILIYI